MKYISIAYILKLHENLIMASGGSKGINRFGTRYCKRRNETGKYSGLDNKS